MIVVSDTTPLNYLILVYATHVLPALFGRVYAPSAVINELSHPRSPQAIQVRGRSRLPRLDHCPGIRRTPTRLVKLGSGEMAAIALAEELKADWVLLDERKGSREAGSRGLRVVGTLVIIEEAGARDLLDYYQTRDRLVGETTFYVTEDVLRESERRFTDASSGDGTTLFSRLYHGSRPD